MTAIGAVSPPGGDMTEPVTAQTERFVRLPLVARPRPGLRAALARGHLAALVLARRAGGRGAGTRSEGRTGWARDRDQGRRRCSPRRTGSARSSSWSGSGRCQPRERMALLAGRLLREGVLAAERTERRTTRHAHRRSRRRSWSSYSRSTTGVWRWSTGACPPRWSRKSICPASVECGTRSDPTTPAVSCAAAMRCWPPWRHRYECEVRTPPPLAALEYHGARDAEGPLLVDRAASTASASTSSRSCGLPRVRSGAALVLEVDRDVAVVEVLEGTAGIDPDSVSVAFDGRPHGDSGRRGVARAGLERHGRAARRRAAHARRPDPSGRRLAAQPDRARRAARPDPDRDLGHRRPDHAGARPEAARLLVRRASPSGAGRPDRRPGERRRRVVQGRRRGDGTHARRRRGDARRARGPHGRRQPRAVRRHGRRSRWSSGCSPRGWP